MSSNQKQLIFSLDLPWTNTHYLLVGLFMIPFGLFVLVQGTIKKKIVQIMLGYFGAFLLFGHEVLSGSSFGLALIGILKITFLGSGIMYGILKTDLLGYGIVGGSAGLLAGTALIFEFGGEVKSLPDFMKEAQGFPMLGMVAGPIICMLSKNRSEILASVIAGVGMIILGISAIASRKDFYKFLYEYKAPLVFLEVVAGLLGVYAQLHFQKKEKELIRQMGEEEKAKNIESTETDYKKMSTSSESERSSSSGNIAPNRDQLRGQPMPQPMRMPMPIPMPMTMGYPPVMQQPGYQPVPHPAYYNPYQSPVVYNPGYMSYSGSPPKQMHGSSPPKLNHKPVQDTKTAVSNVHIKTSNKNYEF